MSRKENVSSELKKNVVKMCKKGQVAHCIDMRPSRFLLQGPPATIKTSPKQAMPPSGSLIRYVGQQSSMPWMPPQNNGDCRYWLNQASAFVLYPTFVHPINILESAV